MFSALAGAGVLLAVACAAAGAAGLVWDGALGQGAQREAGRFFGPTPTPFPPPALDVQYARADKGSLVIAGRGTPGADIEYLGQRVGAVNARGIFTLALPLDTALSVIALDAVDRNGRATRLIEIPPAASAPAQPAALGRVRMTLIGAGTDALAGRPPVQTRAEGIYLKLVISVTSDLSEPLNLRGWNFALSDGQGRVYRPSDQAEFAYGWDTAEGRLAGRVVPPNTALAGWVLFDIAPGASGLVFKASSDGIGPQWTAQLAVPEDAARGGRP